MYCEQFIMSSCLRYQAYYSVDVLNGPGTRCVLFVSGCEHKCKGCYNAKTWQPDSGQYFTREIEDQIIRDLKDTRIRRSGLTLSGGDPLHPINVPYIAHLVERVKDECPDKTIWCWTGYEMENLTQSQRNIASRVDMLIDGKFIESLKSPGLPWRGSSNQRLLTASTLADYFALDTAVPERQCILSVA